MSNAITYNEAKAIHAAAFESVRNEGYTKFLTTDEAAMVTWAAGLPVGTLLLERSACGYHETTYTKHNKGWSNPAEININGGDPFLTDGVFKYSATAKQFGRVLAHTAFGAQTKVVVFKPKS